MSTAGSLRLAGRHRFTQLIYQQRRSVRTVRRTKNTRSTMDGQKWLIHFAHENSFLSWTRNGTISMAAGGGCLLADEQFTMLKLAGQAFADLGLVFMIVGTGEYIYHSYKFRHRLHISTTRMVWVVGYALTLLMAWAYGASYIQGEFGLFNHLAIFKSRISQYYYLESKSETERKIGRFNAMKKD